MVVVVLRVVVVLDVVEVDVDELDGLAVTRSFRKFIGVVVGFEAGLDGSKQTTLHVHPSSRSGRFLAMSLDLNTIFTVSSPENFKLVVLRPQYFF